MTEGVRRLLLAAADGADPAVAVREIWPGPAQAWPELAGAFEEESLDEDNDSVLAVLRWALLALGPPLVKSLCRWFPEADYPVQVNLTLAFAELGSDATEA